MKTKILIFGGSGFIGSYVCEEFVNKGYDVIVADIKPNKYISNAKFIKCDITSIEQIRAVITPDVDYIYNFAGFANLDNSIQNPIATIELNIMGNLYILDEARRKNIKRYIYASSAYALNDKGSFYGISKLSSEKLVEEYYTKYGMEYTIMRYGSVYSERNFDNNYIYSLVEKVIKEGRIEHHGDGNEIREYIHASDIARMAVEIIENRDYVNQYVILTGIERMKRIELFDMIKEILGEDFEVDLKNDGYDHHYKISPYSFQATLSRKMVAKTYIDMGQGILECIKQVKNES